jgi:plastocyanin
MISGIILVVMAVAFQSGDSEIKQEKPQIVAKADVVMPTKVSRPGCEETDSCYIPSKITVKQGQTVTWKNEDVAFHSVTSGFYGEPSTLFDSGYLDPEQKFSVTFDEQGTFDYFCTLHPWMAGKVIVD